MVSIILLAVAAYLLGAVPFGLLVAKAKGINIREHGSGNIGATNVFRVVGKGWGIFTLILDALKGYIPAFIFPKLGNLPGDWGLLFGLVAIIGHSFPVYLKFKGGKGVATSAGMLIGIAPVSVGVGLFVWIVCMAVSRYVSLASIVAAVAVAGSVWYEDRGLVISIPITGLAVLIIWLHRANIKRLLNGTESRFGRKKEAKV